MPVYIAPLLQQIEDRWNRPAGSINLCPHILWQGTRNILIISATSYMNHTVNIEFLNKRQARFWIKTGWSQKLLTNGLAQLVNVLITLEALYIKDNFTNQRVAVGMNTGGRKAKNNIASLYLFTGDNLGLLHSTNSKTSNIIFTLSIEASHFSCLTADKCTARLLAGVGYTLYYISYLLRLQLAYS